MPKNHFLKTIIPAVNQPIGKFERYATSHRGGNNTVGNGSQNISMFQPPYIDICFLVSLPVFSLFSVFSTLAPFQALTDANLPPLLFSPIF